MFPLATGTSLCSRFTLIRPLGRGGMGEVWLAHDDRLDHQVATKVVPQGASAATIELLRRECRNARRLSHPNIVRTFDFHQCDGVSFITMEHVEGGSVESLRGASIQKIVEILSPLAEALHHAHQTGLVHRDVKAGNVLLDSAGQPRLMDFGIAGALRPSSADQQLVGGGSRFSTSPQQLAGDPPQPGDDIYGLGALAYHLLTGRPPFWPDAERERILSEDPEPIDPARAVPPRLRTLVGDMLAKSPAERPPDMLTVKGILDEVAAELSEVDTQAPELRPATVRLTPPPRIEAPSASRRQRQAAGSDGRLRWWATAGVFTILTTLVAGVFLVLPRWVQQRDEHRVAVANGSALTVPDPETPAGATLAEVPKPDDASDPMPGRPADEAGAAESDSARDDAAVSSPARREAAASPREPVVPAPGSSARLDLQRLMSQGLAALADGDSAAAKHAFERALSLAPGSVEAMDGLARAEEEQRLAAVSEHRRRALDFETSEDWRAAMSEYEEVLGLDPTIRFAQEGKTRAAIRSELATELETHLAYPERLSRDEVLERARQLLQQAISTVPPGPILSRQIEALTELVAVAATPLRVELASDNLTDVTIYRVGRLGRFSEQSLELRPGTYIIVGQRAGYRDVRLQLTVAPNEETKPVTVRCKEEI